VSAGATDPAAAPLLQIRGVSRTFRSVDRQVLADVDLDVAAGEFVSLIGPSGCGKTTLLRIVAGLLSATTGSVSLGGAPSDTPSRDKAMVFQHFNLLPWRTALANAAYGLELQGVGKRERHDRALEYLRLFGLEEFADQYPGELSGGMRQRIGIARALAIEPKVLLMDEPFGALDALTRERLQIELLRICETTKLSVVFVTHSIDEAIFLSDRIVVMGTHPGRVVETFDVDLRRPRWTYDMRAEPSYARIRARVWELLDQEMGSTPEAASE
jgi:NitT/TauT family transport system ATP-binding protein